jgi:hypothetical protein
MGSSTAATPRLRIVTLRADRIDDERILAIRRDGATRARIASAEVAALAADAERDELVGVQRSQL